MALGQFVQTLIPPTEDNLIISDGRTVGDSSSTADVTGDQYFPLFEALWNARANWSLTVSGGAGDSALEDWEAHKTISTPEFPQFEKANCLAFTSDHLAIQTLENELPAKLVSETTVKTRAFPVIKTATVGSGVAVYHLTDDGLSTGNALFPNGPELNSVQPWVNNSNASYQYGWAWSNSNKTLTVTVNKYTTANILTGLLGQTPANGDDCTVTVWGN